MAGTSFDLPLSFDLFSSSYDVTDPTYADFSPISLFNPIEDLTDGASSSVPTPNSPLSPALGNSYALPSSGDDWMSWDKIERTPEPDFLKTELFEGPILASVAPSSVSISPAINPIDLSNPVSDEVILGREGINDNQPIFQSPPKSTSLPTPQSLPEKAAEPRIKTEPAMSPEPLSHSAKRYPSRSLKRKSTSSPDDSESQRSSNSPPPALRRSSTKENVKASPQEIEGCGPKKTAHNMIEKRYRNNLNDKIAALRDSVPSLRIMVHRLENQHQGSSEDEGEENQLSMGANHGMNPQEEDLGGLAPAHKLNKATILSKATEYIAHLERKNQCLAKENAALRGRVQGFEMLVMSRGGSRGVWN